MLTFRLKEGSKAGRCSSLIESLSQNPSPYRQSGDRYLVTDFGSSEVETVRITDLHQPVQSPAMEAFLEQLGDAEFSLDPEGILKTAREQLDVPLDIDDGLVSRFATLFEEIVERAPTHNAGRFMLHQLAVNGIIQTSRMNYIRKQNPEIAKTPLARPIIVAGMPRSGTTFLLQLISTNESLLSTARWEVIESFPNQAVLSGKEPDLRAEQAESIHDHLVSLGPMINYLYDIDAKDSTEEIEALVHGCYGVGLSFFGDTPKFDNSFYQTDQIACYTYLYQYLQTMQWVKKASPEQRWLLKSPQHMGALNTLDAVFPEASVVFTHRDPASVFSSLITLLGYVVRRTYSSISKQQLIDRTLRMQHGFLRGIVENSEKFSDRSTHVYFHELREDYAGCIERVFKCTGLHYDAAARARVDKQADSFSRGRRGARVVYDIEEDFGLTRDAIRNEFMYYLEKFPAEIEESHQ